MSDLIDFIRHILKNIVHPRKTGLFTYKDYAHYKKVQIDGNLRKIDNCWVTEENIKYLSEYLKREISDIKFGICHGTRRGKEQEWFRKYLNTEVIGTEISPTASQFPHTIQWDFHELKNEWINSVDFIYSNSFDHSYKPEECLDTWMKCIKKSGVIILEWTTGHVESNELDPFGGTFTDYKKLAKNKYKIKKVLKSPSNKFWKYEKTLFLIISHR